METKKRRNTTKEIIVLAFAALLLFSFTGCDQTQFVYFDTLKEMQEALAGDDFYYFNFESLEYNGNIGLEAKKSSKTGDWLFSYYISLSLENPIGGETNYLFYMIATHHTRPFSEDSQLLKSIKVDHIPCNIYHSDIVTDRFLLRFEIEEYQYIFGLQRFERTLEEELEYFISLSESLILSRYQLK